MTNFGKFGEVPVGGYSILGISQYFSEIIYMHSFRPGPGYYNIADPNIACLFLEKLSSRILCRV